MHYGVFSGHFVCLCAFSLKSVWKTVTLRVNPKIDIWQYKVAELDVGSGSISWCQGNWQQTQAAFQLRAANMSCQIAFEATGRSYKFTLRRTHASVWASNASIWVCCLYQENTEAKASFEQEYIVNYPHIPSGSIIPLLKMGVTHEGTTFHCWCNSEELRLYLRKPHDLAFVHPA